MTTRYRVLTHLVISRSTTGVMHHRYRDELLPEDAAADHIKQLLGDNMIIAIGEEPAIPEEDGSPS